MRENLFCRSSSTAIRTVRFPSVFLKISAFGPVHTPRTFTTSSVPIFVGVTLPLARSFRPQSGSCPSLFLSSRYPCLLSLPNPLILRSYVRCPFDQGHNVHASHLFAYAKFGSTSQSSPQSYPHHPRYQPLGDRIYRTLLGSKFHLASCPRQCNSVRVRNCLKVVASI